MLYGTTAKQPLLVFVPVVAISSADVVPHERVAVKQILNPIAPVGTAWVNETLVTIPGWSSVTADIAV